MRYFALRGTDHRTHTEQDTAIGAYIRWRNHHAKPKTSFATGSKIATRITRSRLHDEALLVRIREQQPQELGQSGMPRTALSPRWASCLQRRPHGSPERPNVHSSVAASGHLPLPQVS